MQVTEKLFIFVYFSDVHHQQTDSCKPKPYQNPIKVKICAIGIPNITATGQKKMSTVLGLADKSQVWYTQIVKFVNLIIHFRQNNSKTTTANLLIIPHYTVINLKVLKKIINTRMMQN